jgi:RAB protein geranylgeranyltransferase component A
VQLALTFRALSRCGKSVLHVDKNEFYGGSNASYAANDFLDMFAPITTEGIHCIYAVYVIVS